MIILHSLEALGTISSIHVELEHLKIWLAHVQFSRSTTLPTYVSHMTLDPRLPLFYCAC